MHGPEILVRFLTDPAEPDRHGIRWQYHSRSDRHSKVGSWGVAFDLICHSGLLREHASTGKVVLGVNHRMVDYATGRRKDLDLVIARPAAGGSIRDLSFAGLADRYRIPLTDDERNILVGLPDIPVAPVGAVLVALEAKACMTAHVKSLPRLYDELNSSHLCVHGASKRALAIGYVHVNASTQFVSPIVNNSPLVGTPAVVSIHRQPGDTERVLAKVAEIPRRSASSEVGFDGIGVTVVDLRNDGSPVRLVTDPPAPQQGEAFHYESMITRMSNEYDAAFLRI